MTDTNDARAVAWLVTSGDAKVICYSYGTAEAQAFELRKGGYPARIEPLFPASVVEELWAKADEISDARDNWKALADEAIYVGCMIGLDCASALADLQERGQYVPKCDDGKPSRANSRRDAEKIADIYRRGLALLRGATNTGATP